MRSVTGKADMDRVKERRIWLPGTDAKRGARSRPPRQAS